MDVFIIGFVFGAAFGFVAGVTCIIRVPKNSGVAQVMDPKKIRQLFEENEKHKVFRPFEPLPLDQPAVIIEGRDAEEVHRLIEERRKKKENGGS